MKGCFERILKRKTELGLSWYDIARQAGIQMSTWMTGSPVDSPSDAELEKMAEVLKTSYSYLKNGE